MRYIGSKLGLLSNIKSVFETIPTTGTIVVGDIFCGTAVVSQMFKEIGHKVIANDGLTFCYTLAVATLKVNSEPDFAQLMKSGELKKYHSNQILNNPYDNVLEYLNQLSGIDGFIYREYSPGGTKGKEYERQYFSNVNARKVDAARARISTWYSQGLLTEPEACLLISDLLQASNRVANIAGTYGCFMKHWDVRALKPLRLERSTITWSQHSNEVFSEDANQLAKRIPFDVLYLDPPYTWRHYGAYYHILETIAKGDEPTIKGKTGLRPWQDSKSRYCNRTDAVNALKELIVSANSRHILLSYNSEGLISHEQIMNILSLRGDPNCHEIAYRRYKSNNGGDQKKQVKERLYYVGI